MQNKTKKTVLNGFFLLLKTWVLFQLSLLYVQFWIMQHQNFISDDQVRDELAKIGITDFLTNIILDTLQINGSRAHGDQLCPWAKAQLCMYLGQVDCMCIHFLSGVSDKILYTLQICPSRALDSCICPWAKAQLGIYKVIVCVSSSFFFFFLFASGV